MTLGIVTKADYPSRCTNIDVCIYLTSGRLSSFLSIELMLFSNSSTVACLIKIGLFQSVASIAWDDEDPAGKSSSSFRTESVEKLMSSRDDKIRARPDRRALSSRSGCCCCRSVFVVQACDSLSIECFILGKTFDTGECWPSTSLILLCNVRVVILVVYGVFLSVLFALSIICL